MKMTYDEFFGRKLPNKDFRKLVKSTRDPEFKKEIYEQQEQRGINWSIYTKCQIKEVEETLNFIRDSINSLSSMKIRKNATNPKKLNNQMLSSLKINNSAAALVLGAIILLLVVLVFPNLNRIMYSPSILADNTTDKVFPMFLIITAIFSFIMWVIVMKRNAKEKAMKGKIERGKIKKGKVDEGKVEKGVRNFIKKKASINVL